MLTIDKNNIYKQFAKVELLLQLKRVEEQFNLTHKEIVNILEELLSNIKEK
jgi:hypothetical protein